MMCFGAGTRSSGRLLNRRCQKGRWLNPRLAAALLAADGLEDAVLGQQVVILQEQFLVDETLTKARRRATLEMFGFKLHRSKPRPISALEYFGCTRSETAVDEGFFQIES